MKAVEQHSESFIEETTVGSPEKSALPGSPTWSDDSSLKHLSGALRLVRRLCPDLPVLAIRWMHLKHPIHPVQEDLLRADAAVEHDGSRSVVGSFRRMALCILYAIYLSFLMFRLRLALRREIELLRRQSFDLVGKSWSFGMDLPADGNDFYYGDLDLRLLDRGVRFLLLSSDVRGGELGFPGHLIQFARKYVSTSGRYRLPELCLVHPFAPIQMMFKQLMASIRLKWIARHVHDPLVGEICRRASEDCLFSAVLREGLLFWVGRAAVQNWHPKAFVTLYEGLGWERCVWPGVKSADTSCQTVGYQHTVLFRESFSLIHPTEEVKGWSVPDVVLCLGEIPRELMRKGHEPYGIRMVRFGSFRCQNTKSVQPCAQPARRTVLVTPEGIVSEVKILFSFAYRCAQRLPSYTFILRSHLEVPMMEQALHLVDGSIRNQPNIVISTDKDINNDFRRASVLMYRGSSTVTFAVASGLLPIYVHMDGRVVSDPLYLLHSWRRWCTTPDEFASILRWYEQSPREELEAEWSVATNFLADYTISVQDENIRQFLASVGIQEERIR